ncbi:hypothetical protein GOODEAATRI_022935 [Goodea atripinnis]|uniref:Uncharacterized protein n=1 Tax=Goodea atripinnis TaxID=208336 RepID=A0ABV0NMH3_9TELE
MWSLLTSRSDVAPLLFPKLSEILFTPQMLLDKVTWPVMNTDDDEGCDAKSMCRIAGFPRTFIETGVACSN